MYNSEAQQKHPNFTRKREWNPDPSVCVTSLRLVKVFRFGRHRFITQRFNTDKNHVSKQRNYISFVYLRMFLHKNKIKQTYERQKNLENKQTNKTQNSATQ